MLKKSSQSLKKQNIFDSVFDPYFLDVFPSVSLSLCLFLKASHSRSDIKTMTDLVFVLIVSDLSETFKTEKYVNFFYTTVILNT